MEFIGPSPGSPEYDKIYHKLDNKRNPAEEIITAWYGKNINIKIRKMEYCGPRFDEDDEFDSEYLIGKCYKAQKHLHNADVLLCNLINSGAVDNSLIEPIHQSVVKAIKKLNKGIRNC